MTGVGEPREQFPLVEIGFYEANIHQMGATEIRVVHDKQVAGLDVFGVIDDGLSGAGREFSIKGLLTDFFVGLEVMDWQELEPQAAAMFVYVDSAIFIWFLVIMGALIFGLINTLITAVMERIREFGMLRAVGMKPGSVIMQVVFESTLIMVVGVGIGVVVGWLLTTQWLGDGIDLSQWAEGVEMAGMRSVLRPYLMVQDVLLVTVLSLVFGVLAALYPAWRAVKIKPLEALRR